MPESRQRATLPLQPPIARTRIKSPCTVVSITCASVFLTYILANLCLSLVRGNRAAEGETTQRILALLLQRLVRQTNLPHKKIAALFMSDLPLPQPAPSSPNFGAGTVESELSVASLKSIVVVFSTAS